MKTYRVGVSFEEGVAFRIIAGSVEEAVQKIEEVMELYGGVDYPEQYQQDTVHRDYMVTDVVEV